VIGCECESECEGEGEGEGVGVGFYREGAKAQRNRVCELTGCLARWREALAAAACRRQAIPCE
jgi:hypothetical protein